MQDEAKKEDSKIEEIESRTEKNVTTETKGGHNHCCTSCVKIKRTTILKTKIRRKYLIKF